MTTIYMMNGLMKRLKRKASGLLRTPLTLNLEERKLSLGRTQLTKRPRKLSMKRLMKTKQPIIILTKKLKSRLLISILRRRLRKILTRRSRRVQSKLRLKSRL